MSDHFYRAFEETHRGSRQLIKERLAIYLPFVTPLLIAYPDASAIDLGCGRGEWLETLRDQGFHPTGVDLDEGMLHACHEAGLEVIHDDAIAVLAALPDESQAVVSAFHVVEHIGIDALHTLIAHAHRVLKPGGLLIMETPNPENIVVGTNYFYVDPTHLRPIPSLLLSFLAEFHKFSRVKTLGVQESKSLKAHNEIGLFEVFCGVSPDYAIVAQKQGNAALTDALDAAFDKDYGLSLESLASRYDKRIRQSETRVQAQLKMLQEKIAQQEATAHHWHAQAHQFHEQILLLRSSVSWRVTKPLRGLRRLASGDFSPVRLVAAAVTQKLKPVLMPPALKPALRACAKRVAPFILRHPALSRALLRISPQRFQVLQQITRAATRFIETESTRPSQTLSPRAAQIHKMLRTLAANRIEQHNQHAGAVFSPDAAPQTEKRLRLAYIYAPVFALPDNGEHNRGEHKDDAHAALLPILSRDYEVEIVADPAEIRDARLRERYPIRTVEWFRAHASAFERVLYHFGDSPACQHLFDLLEEIPGVIVLHDFSLSTAQSSRKGANAWAHALYASHGYPALLANHADKTAAIQRYPVNLPVLQAALGVIVHSEAARHQGEAWYGKNAVTPWAVLPPPCAKTSEHAARQYAGAIENHYQTAPGGRLHRLMTELKHDAAEPGVANLAVTLAEDFPPEPKKRYLFVDISALVEVDHKTGIQRVVRAILREWINRADDEWRVEPVYASKNCYRYARKFTSRFLGVDDKWAEDVPVEAWAGDIFFALDFHSSAVIADKAILERWRDRGAKVGFLVYDLLPISHPDCFPVGTAQNHQHWLETICSLDFSICISRSVAEELQQWLAAANGVKRQRPYRIEWSHIGADLASSVPTRGMPPNGAEQLRYLRASPSFLMVGTIEPRKGHREVLETFERLWAEGRAINLVIVGKKGWMQDALIQRLHTRMAQEKRLIWLEGISDEYLEAVYAASVCLIAASYAEGFGLPLIEAARHKLPVIARDIPVFREVAGQHAYYFTDDLAGSIETWLTRYAQNQHPKSDQMPWLTWQESADQLWRLITN
jgi:glycosyltransferase involved in cell wall biosynthesis/SAM-dependent methyltransferase